MCKLKKLFGLKSNRKNISIKIFGDFQGTALRFSAMHEAYKAGVTGIVRYTTDQAVYFEAEGNIEQLERFKGWCLEMAEMYEAGKPEICFKRVRGYTDFNIIE
jgi:acylphosphatase